MKKQERIEQLKAAIKNEEERYDRAKHDQSERAADCHSHLLSVLKNDLAGMERLL